MSAEACLSNDTTVEEAKQADDYGELPSPAPAAEDAAAAYSGFVWQRCDCSGHKSPRGATERRLSALSREKREQPQDAPALPPSPVSDPESQPQPEQPEQPETTDVMPPRLSQLSPAPTVVTAQLVRQSLPVTPSQRNRTGFVAPRLSQVSGNPLFRDTDHQGSVEVIEDEVGADVVESLEQHKKDKWLEKQKRDAEAAEMARRRQAPIERAGFDQLIQMTLEDAMAPDPTPLRRRNASPPGAQQQPQNVAVTASAWKAAARPAPSEERRMSIQPAARVSVQTTATTAVPV